MGEFGSEKFSTGIDSKRVKNNLQGFEGNLHSLLDGWGVKTGGTDRAHTLHIEPGTFLAVSKRGLAHFCSFSQCAPAEGNFRQTTCAVRDVRPRRIGSRRRFFDSAPTPAT